MPGRTQATEEPAAAALAPEIEERLPMWRQRLLEIAQAKQPAAERLNELRWRLGREMIEVIAGHPAGGGKTAVMNALARQLGCSRPTIYDLTAVAEAFPDELPEQNWSVLRDLAGMDAKERKQWLTRLQPWAKVSELPRSQRERMLTPEAAAGSEDLARRREVALQAFDDLAPMQKPPFVIGIIERLDLTFLPPSERTEILRRIESAVAALRNPAPGLAAEGATLDGADDIPT